MCKNYVNITHEYTCTYILVSLLKQNGWKFRKCLRIDVIINYACPNDCRYCWKTLLRTIFLFVFCCCLLHYYHCSITYSRKLRVSCNTNFWHRCMIVADRNLSRRLMRNIARFSIIIIFFLLPTSTKP